VLKNNYNPVFPLKVQIFNLIIFLNFHLVKSYITQIGKKTFYECYESVIIDLPLNLDTEKIFTNESFALFEFLIHNSMYRLPNEDRLALMMV
jgi:hypothetical protein